MEYIKHFFSNYISLDPLNFLGALLGISFSIFLFKTETSTDIIKLRYEKVISPLFNILEPILFRELPSSTTQFKIECIINNNRQWVDGKLLSYYFFYKTTPNQKTFYNLCVYINSSYDFCCRKLGIPTRTFTYRLVNKQFHNRTSLVWAYIKPLLIFLLIFTLSVFTGSLIYILFTLFFAETLATSILFSILIICNFILAVKLLYRLL